MAVGSRARRDGSHFVTEQGAELSTTEPLVAAAMNELCDHWPGSLVFPDLVARASQRVARATPDAEAVDRLRGVLLEAYVLPSSGCRAARFPRPVSRAAARGPAGSRGPRRPADIR
jgi:hypothetical protein